MHFHLAYPWYAFVPVGRTDPPKLVQSQLPVRPANLPFPTGYTLVPVTERSPRRCSTELNSSKTWSPSVDDRQDVSDQIRALVRLDFVREAHAATEPRFTFKHALTQEVCYESLDGTQRLALHEQAGRARLTRALEIFEEIGHLLEPDRIRGELGAMTQAQCLLAPDHGAHDRPAR